MKKKYEQPELWIVPIVADRLLNTDSDGEDDDFGARRGSILFDDEGDGEDDGWPGANSQADLWAEDE